MTEIQRLELKVDAISKEQAEQGQNIVLIKNAVKGDDMGNKGVFPILGEHDKAIKELQENEKKRKWFIAGFSSAFGFISGLVGGPVIKWLGAKIILPVAAKISGILL